MKTIRILSLSLALAALTACGGFAGMAYNNAPRFVAGELDDAFDLDRRQIERLDSRLEQFFAWHRDEELARYRRVLDRAALAAADGIDADEFLALRDEVGAAFERALEKVIDDLGDLAIDLTPAQIARYDEYHREGSEEYLERLEKSPQQRETERVDRAYKRLEKWFGDFDLDFEERARARLREVPDIMQPWYEFREQRHQALLAALRDIANDGFDRERLRRILLDPDTAHARAFEPARRAYWQGYATALEDISSWMSERQRQRVVTRLQRYARVVERLRGQG